MPNKSISSCNINIKLDKPKQDKTQTPFNQIYFQPLLMSISKQDKTQTPFNVQPLFFTMPNKSISSRCKFRSPINIQPLCFTVSPKCVSFDHFETNHKKLFSIRYHFTLIKDSLNIRNAQFHRKIKIDPNQPHISFDITLRIIDSIE
jgi:hypothetical protein